MIKQEDMQAFLQEDLSEQLGHISVVVTEVLAMGERVQLCKFSLNGYDMACCVIQNGPNEHMALIPTVYLKLFLPRFQTVYRKPNIEQERQADIVPFRGRTTKKNGRGTDGRGA